MDGHVPASTKMEDWIDTRTPEQMNQLFGPQRAAMYRSGAIDLRDLLGPKGLQPLSLEDLWMAHADELLAAGFMPSGFPGAVSVRRSLGL